MRAVMLLLSAVVAAIDYDGPRFRLSNGTLLEEDGDMRIPRGTSLELYCSGEGNNLKIFKMEESSEESFGNRDLATLVNRTSVRIFNEYSECGYHVYHCDDTETENSTWFTIVVETLPVVSDFKCRIDSVDYMHCDWQTDNAYVTNASLSYENDGILIRLCRWERVITPSNRCTWDSVHSQIPFYAISILHQTLTFMVKGCVGLGCSEQTYEIDPMRIIKTIRPDLTILGKTYNSVTLHCSPDTMADDTGVNIWRYMSLYEPRLDYMECRIIYVQAGVQEFRLNYTAVIDVFDDLKTINFTIQLPCPETFYEVKVSVKPSTVVGEEYWSDEAEVSLVTDPAPEGLDICAPQRVKITPEVMLAEVDRLRTRMVGELRALREGVQALRLKADHYKQPKELEENVGPEDFQD